MIGLVLPVLTSLLFFRYGYGGMLSYWPFLVQMFKIGGFGMLIAVCCLPNLAVFTVVMNLGKYLVSRGLMVATFLYAFGIVVIKFLL